MRASAFGRNLTVHHLRDLIKRLHAYHLSDENPNRSTCSKLFIGRGSGGTIGLMGAFTPSGVMVGHKVVHPWEGPQDVSDMVGTMLVRRLCPFGSSRSMKIARGRVARGSGSPTG